MTDRDLKTAEYIEDAGAELTEKIIATLLWAESILGNVHPGNLYTNQAQAEIKLIKKEVLGEN